jgi:hypothetical protein
MQLLNKSWGLSMRSYVLILALAALAVGAHGQDCKPEDFASFSDLKGAVSRLLSFPGYTGFDEKILNRSGDLAAVAIIRSVSTAEMDSPEKIRQILLILRMAFEAPQLILACDSRGPAATMFLLDRLLGSKSAAQFETDIQNTKAEVQHNTNTGRPQEIVTLGERSKIDWEHTNWISSVLAWIQDVKPGMTRMDLLKVFTTEGGLSNRSRQTYVLKQCPYIKVDVEFAPATNEQDRLTEMPEDKIEKISRPYLAYSIMD